jgi:hypothetical protein
MLFWRETYFAFYLPRTLCFSLLLFQRVFSFSATAFTLCFFPWFLFRSCFILASRCIWASGICWFSSKEFPQKGLNGVGKEKKLYAKSGTKRSFCRLRPGLLHVMFDVVLIVCLVIFAVAWLVSNNWDCLMSLWKNHVLFLSFGSINLVFSFDALVGLTWRMLTPCWLEKSRL